MKKFTLSLVVVLLLINSLKASNFYWVGGTGNWSDYSTHWATTSGGTIFHTTIPTANDDVFFDGNSFSGAGTITFDSIYSECKNFDASGLAYAVDFTNPQTSYIDLDVYGNLTASQLANWQPSSAVAFMFINMRLSVGTRTITSNGCRFYTVYLYGIGTVELTDDFSCWNLNTDMDINFYTNNHQLDVFEIVNGNSQTVFNIGSSVVFCNGWLMNGAVTSINAKFYLTSSIIAAPNVVVPVVFDSIFCTGNSCSIRANFGCNYLQGPSGTLQVEGFNDYVINIKKAIVLGDCQIATQLSVDTFYVTTPGTLITLDDTLQINNELYIASLPTSMSQINWSFSTPVISKASGQICLDYILLDYVQAIGGAQFYAGSNSVDLGGSTGWQFTNCAPVIGNVWPGDANYDLTCDNLDLLNIGLSYGNSGTGRNNASNTWVAQQGTNWPLQFMNGVNYKHADCDGDGTVSFPDTLAISQNYGLTHPARVGDNSSNNSFGAQLYFDVPTTSLQPGSIVTVPIHFGTSTAPVNNLYGIAFTVDYDATLIQPNSVFINYTGSWLPTAGSYLHIERDFSATGKIDMALTRTDHLNVSDYGTIANLVFTVANSASGPLQLGFSKIRAVSANELEIPVQANPVSVVTSVNSLDPENAFTVFPNPFKNQVAAINSNYKTGQPIEVFNIYGTKIYSGEFTSEKVLLDTETWSKGVYFIHTGGSVVKVTKTN